MSRTVDFEGGRIATKLAIREGLATRETEEACLVILLLADLENCTLRDRLGTLHALRKEQTRIIRFAVKTNCGDFAVRLGLAFFHRKDLIRL